VTRVKICGIMRLEDGLAALEAGADLLGFVFYPPSHRYRPPRHARSIIEACRARFGSRWQAVGVFVNEPLDELNAIAEQVGLDLVQLCGDEDAAYCAAVNRPAIKVVRVDERGRPSGSTDARDWNAVRVLLDTDRAGHYGGTGEAYDWACARPFAGQALLAGGLSPENAATAITLAQPWGLDVSSGVERDRQKDPELIRRFIQEVRRHGGDE
jgi:phosphoribosylanthranilate isomerase